MRQAKNTDDEVVVIRERTLGDPAEVRVETVGELPAKIPLVVVRTPPILGVLVNRRYLPRHWVRPIIGGVIVAFVIAEFAADLIRDGRLELVQFFQP